MNAKDFLQAGKTYLYNREAQETAYSLAGEVIQQTPWQPIKELDGQALTIKEVRSKDLIYTIPAKGEGNIYCDMPLNNKKREWKKEHGTSYTTLVYSTFNINGDILEWTRENGRETVHNGQTIRVIRVDVTKFTKK